MAEDVQYSDSSGNKMDKHAVSDERCEQQLLDDLEEESRPEKRSIIESEEVGEFDSFTTVLRKTSRKRVKQAESRKEVSEETEMMEFNKEEEDKEKFIVTITSKEILPKQFGMAKLLRSEDIKKILQITFKNPYRVIVAFENLEECEKLINNEKLESLGYRCQMIDEVSLSYGLVRHVDLDIDEKEALENLDCEFEIISVKRLKRLAEEGKWVDSETIRLSIKGATLPPYVYGYGCRFKVEPYKFPVSQCSGCWRFGHLSRACPAKKPVCPKCSQNHKNCDTDKYKCVNCKGSHMALFKECPVFLKEKEIRNIMSSENCTYKKAFTAYLEKNKNKNYNEKNETIRRERNSIEHLETTVETSQKSLDMGKRSYKNVLITKAVVHREDPNLTSESDNIFEEEEKADTESEWKKKEKKKKKKKKSKTGLQTDEVMDYFEPGVDKQNNEMGEDKIDRDENSLISKIGRLVNKTINIFKSDDSFEDKIKRVFSLIIKDAMSVILSLVTKEKLLSLVITFLSGDSYS